ncbi:MAG: hypothetical protein QM811_25945 [Pirellulales bacterium]
MSRLLAILAVVIAWTTGSFVRADHFILTNDGRVTGELVVDPNIPKTQIKVRTRSGGEILLDKAQIKEMIGVTKDEEEYDVIRGAAPDTVEGQWKLAEWCRQHSMTKQRNLHLERLLQLDPNHKEARVALNYRQVNGRWVRREDEMLEKGYVLHKGQWKLPQEVELLEQKSASEAKEREWYGKLNRLRADFVNGTPAKSQAAWETLITLDDPHAVPAILKAMPNEQSTKMLRAYITALGRMRSGAAFKTLVDLTMGAGGARDEYQELALEQLQKAKSSEAVSLIAAELKSKDNKRVNRAGHALGQLGDPIVIPALIDTIVTKHKFILQQGGNGSMSATFGSGGGGLGVGGKTQVIEQTMENYEVLTALEKLSGQAGLGYNQAAWTNWYQTNKKKPIVAGRRD